MRTIPEFSEDGRILASVLREAAINDVVDYGRLSQAIGRNVQREGRSALDSARRLLQREARMIFAPVRGSGLKRLSDAAIVSTSQSTVRHINRSARRGVQRLACVQDFSKLTKEEMIRHNTSMSLLAVFYEITQVKNMKQLESVVAVTQKVLPLADTLQAFRV